MGFLKYSQNFLGEHPPLFENLSVIPLVHKCGSVCFIVFPLLSGILPLVLFSILPSTSPTLCVPLSQTETKLEVCDSSVLESLILFTAGSQWVNINPWLWPTVPLRPQCQQCRVSMCCNQGLYSDNKINTKSEQFKGRCTYYVIKFCPICDPPPFRLEWNAHPIPAGVELSHSIPAGMEWALHSGRNGMNTPFLQEWNDSIPFLLTLRAAGHSGS